MKPAVLQKSAMRPDAGELPAVLSHRWIDLINLEESLAIAGKIRRKPSLMRVAQTNLRRWRKRRSPHREWEQILKNNSIERVLEILTQDNDEGQRLRQGDPFVGILTAREHAYFLRYDDTFRRQIAARIARRKGRN